MCDVDFSVRRGQTLPQGMLVVVNSVTVLDPPAVQLQVYLSLSAPILVQPLCFDTLLKDGLLTWVVFLIGFVRFNDAWQGRQVRVSLPAQ
eukprot:1217326-Amphidinium_carterae.1